MAAALDLLAAAIVGDEAAVRQMLAADQQIAAATHSPDDVTALHYAAYYDKCGVTQLLLAAAPKTISSRTFPGLTPLHCAAVNGASAVVQLLVEADPAGAFVVDKHGNTPLLAALAGLRQKGRRRESFLASACCLVQAAQTVQPALDTLNRYQPDLNSAAASLYADLASHLPLADAQWQLVPAPCPALAHALPAVSERSIAEAGWLVGRLAADQRSRLRTAALSLARVQHNLLRTPGLPADPAHPGAGLARLSFQLLVFACVCKRLACEQGLTGRGI